MEQFGRGKLTFLAFLVGVTAISFVGLGVAMGSLQDKPQEEVLLSINRSSEPKPIRLLEAREIALRGASDWSSKAAMLELASIEDPQTTGRFAGNDGQRTVWRATFVATDQPGERLIVTIMDGEITQMIVGLGDDPVAPITEAAALDSDAALALAQGALDIQPASDKAHGVHFVLAQDKEAGITVIRVVGSYSNHPAFVAMDARTGTIIARKSYEPVNGGVLYSADAGATWSPSSLRGTVPVLAADPHQEKCGYALVIEDGLLILYNTQDGGATWSRKGSLPANAGSWANSLAVRSVGGVTHLLVGTPSGLWIGNLNSLEWERSLRLPDGAGWRVMATRSGLVLVNVVDGPRSGTLFSSTDLTDWQAIDSGVLRLSRLIDTDAVLAIDEAAQATFVITSGGQRLSDNGLRGASLGTDVLPLRVAGTSQTWIAQSPWYMRFSADGGTTWKTSLIDSRLASLAIPPDFASSGIAIAGGFRSGIYRTTDFGRSWSRVVEDPAILVPGSGELSSVEFLGSQSVIISNLGKLTWENIR